MTTDLFPVEKSQRPRRSAVRAAEVKAFKQAHDIETHNAGKGFGPGKWSAIHWPTVRKCPYYEKGAHDTMFDAIAGLCRVLEEEMHCLTEGDTEREAIRELCHNLGITCTL
jgi:hypothetical protein